MPEWVQDGFGEYAKRLPPECALKLVEIPAEKRGKTSSAEQLRAKEAERIKAAIPKGAHVIALEVGGKSWSTEQLSTQMQRWMRLGSDVALLVGGPDGLDASCRDLANEQWSLSPLTLPHPLVRVVLAEQLYRAWSVLAGHPYHRGG